MVRSPWVMVSNLLQALSLLTMVMKCSFSLYTVLWYSLTASLSPGCTRVGRCQWYQCLPGQVNCPAVAPILAPHKCTMHPPCPQGWSPWRNVIFWQNLWAMFPIWQHSHWDHCGLTQIWECSNCGGPEWPVGSESDKPDYRPLPVLILLSLLWLSPINSLIW